MSSNNAQWIVPHFVLFSLHFYFHSSQIHATALFSHIWTDHIDFCTSPLFFLNSFEIHLEGFLQILSYHLLRHNKMMHTFCSYTMRIGIHCPQTLGLKGCSFTYSNNQWIQRISCFRTDTNIKHAYEQHD